MFFNVKIAFPLKQLAAASILLAAIGAQAFSLDALSNQDASTGMKAALDKGAVAAVAQLGVENGFLGNDKVKIPLPSILEKARPILKMTGKGQQLDDLVVAMNHAAEAAVPMAKPLLLNAVKSMSLTDAKNILSGGDTSVTDFFKQKTAPALYQKFLPAVKGATDKVALSAQYNNVVSQVQKFGAVPAQEASVEAYVTQKALDGLFLIIAEQEQAIRKDPLAAGSNAIAKVFGLMK